MLSLSSLVFLVLTLIVIGNVQAFNEDSIESEEIVQIKTLKSTRANRYTRRVRFVIDGKEFHFDFVPSQRDVYSRDIPVWLAKSKPGNSPNYTYELVEGSENMISNGQFYVDNAKNAVVFVHYDEKNHEILYDGLFGESKTRYLIQSLPENARARLRRGSHVISRVKTETKLYDSPKKHRDLSIKPLETKLEKPLETLYPKILAVVDYHLFEKLGNDIAATIKYVATFWNFVDQYYVPLESPKVQLVLTGIIIANDEKALNYVYKSRNWDEDPNSKVNLLKPQELQEHMRLYFRHDFPNDNDFQNYDAAILMAGLHTGMVAGITTIGKICSIWYNIAVVRDDGLYDGVRTATHELGHMLNLKHDNFSDDGECPSFTNDNGTAIMAPAITDTNYIFWSECSKKSLHEFAQLQASECLQNRKRERIYDEDEWF